MKTMRLSTHLLPLLLAGAGLLGACAGSPASSSSLRPAEFQGRLSAPGVQLVDVRQPEEYAEGHLKGAKLLPLGELEGRLGELDKSKPVLLYCRSGKRSTKALALVTAAGFKAEQLDGGVLAWDAAGLPLER
jgi:rhodanese-related sulfurtransferase